MLYGAVYWRRETSQAVTLFGFVQLLLQGGSTLGEVVAALGAEFEVAPPVAERDVIEFIGQLRNAFK